MLSARAGGFKKVFEKAQALLREQGFTFSTIRDGRVSVVRHRRSSAHVNGTALRLEPLELPQPRLGSASEAFRADSDTKWATSGRSIVVDQFHRSIAAGAIRCRKTEERTLRCVAVSARGTRKKNRERSTWGALAAKMATICAATGDSPTSALAD